MALFPLLTGVATFVSVFPTSLYYQSQMLSVNYNLLIFIQLISVWICIVDHEPCPLGHLPEMPVRVVEVFDGGDVGLGAEAERLLQSRLVTVDAGQDGDVVLLVEHLVGRPVPLVRVPGRHVADDLARVGVPELLPYVS